MILKLSESDRAKLIKLTKQSKYVNARNRLRSIIAYGGGKSVKAISSILCLSEDTI